jgi:hypothetical protein
LTAGQAVLVRDLMNRKAAFFLSAEMLTEPAMVQTRYTCDGAPVMKKEVKTLEASGKTVTATLNPFWKKNVLKRRVCRLLCNFHYDEGVQRRLEKENAERIAKGEAPKEFKQGESWHELMLDENGHLTPFCKHKETGVVYLRCMDIATDEVEYTVDGAKVDAESIKPFLSKSDYKNQGLDEPLVFLCYALSSIKRITFDGQTYVP